MKKADQRYFRSYSVWIHIFLWLAYFAFPLLFFFQNEVMRRNYLIMGSFLTALVAIFFYYNYLFLIPRYFLKKKMIVYFLLLLAGLIVICLVNVVGVYISYHIDKVVWYFPFKFRSSFIYPMSSCFLAFALSSAIRITREWLRNERQRKEMQADKLASELAFLKSQVNPHFLFNTLNNICSLARKKSDHTEDAIIKLADIMRFMLEDSEHERVGLDKELEYLHGYIELQRLRLPEQVKISFNITGNPDRHSIEPLLLIPFVENAFKHGISYQEPVDIVIALEANEDDLVFRVENNIVKSHEGSTQKGSGTSLKNVIRRLELLYPGTHSLKIQDTGNRYIVELKLKQ